MAMAMVMPRCGDDMYLQASMEQSEYQHVRLSYCALTVSCQLMNNTSSPLVVTRPYHLTKHKAAAGCCCCQLRPLLAVMKAAACRIASRPTYTAQNHTR